MAAAMPDSASPSRKPHGLTDAQIKEFKEVFDLMDKDGGGSLSIDEIKQLMDMLGLKMRPDELEEIMADIDLDGSGHVDFEEFLQVMAKPQDLPYKRTDVMRAFNMFTRPDDPAGSIHPQALEEALLKYGGDKFSQNDIVRLVNGLDLTAGGFIEFEKKINLFVNK